MNRTSLSDLLLPGVVVAVVSMMLFPLPPFILDLLLACNIAFSLALLVSAVYLTESDRFTALPAILLISTLFRLGLNISTTRVILSSGTAPQIVIAFGDFVVQGQVLVGLVIFLIISLVQFLVIAKGAERVAEVAARFTLDAMPGKQMAIDADIRAGLLSVSDARERRRGLQRESKLYGALDGAMKFVKGDAIAGLIITAINICAGLFVGVSEFGLSFQEALHRYTIFTVGDGLVSQIPALLVSVAAGIAVTRVEDTAGSRMSRDVLRQLSQEPAVLGTSGVVLIAFGCVPGFPTLPFVGIGLLFCVLAFGSRAERDKAETLKKEIEFRPQAQAQLVLRLSGRLAQRVQQERTLPKLFRDLRERMFTRFGIYLPEAQCDILTSESGLGVEIVMNGTRCHAFKILERADQNSSLPVSPLIIRHLEEYLAQHPALIMNDTQSRILLELHQSQVEDLSQSLIPSVISMTGLTTLLRALLSERGSVRELSAILQAIAEHDLAGAKTENGTRKGGANENNLKRLEETLISVRHALRGQILQTLMGDARSLCAWILDEELDAFLCAVADAGAPLHPRLQDQILEAAKTAFAKSKAPLVLVTESRSRYLVSKLLRVETPELWVLSAEELTRDVELNVAGIIALKIPIKAALNQNPENAALNDLEAAEA